MPLQKITNYVRNNIAPNPNRNVSDKRIDKFISELEASRNIGDIRLYFCIAIDIKSSIKKYNSNDISANPLIKALRECILESDKYRGKVTKTFPNGIPPQVRFALATKKPSTYKPCFTCTTSEVYSRVISFKSYLRYVVKQNLTPTLAATIPEDIDDSVQRRYLLSYLNKDQFKDIQITRLGRNDSWVFVANNSEITATNYQFEDKVAEIVDRLGYYISNLSTNDYFICLEYDENFEETVYQPESITADWGNLSNYFGLGNEFFLSYGLVDEWGRTQCISGLHDSIKERIHESFDYRESKFYKMKTHKIGNLSKIVSKGNMPTLISEAVSRFNNA